MKSCHVAIRLDNPLNGAHGHWSTQARKRKRQRQSTQISWVLDHMPRALEPGMRVKIVRLGPRSLDSDNLQAACKSVRDAVAEMLGINDRMEIWDYGQERGEYGVRIEITP